MEPKVNYTVVGLFVVFLTIALVYVIFWLTADISHKQYSTYVTYVNESVSGLTEESTVKYNGVDIGFVKNIRLVPNNPQQVQLILKIESNILIHSDTLATIQVQGLTGVGYVGLHGGQASSPILKSSNSKPYPEIKSTPSLLLRVDTAVSDLSNSLQSITHNINSILNPRNQEALQTTLLNVEKISKALGNHAEKLDSIILNTDLLMKNTAQASQELPQLIHNTKQGINSLTAASNEVEKTMRSSRNIIIAIENQLLPQTIVAFEKINQITTQIETITAEIKQNPSILIRGRTPAKLGPGE